MLNKPWGSTLRARSPVCFLLGFLGAISGPSPSGLDRRRHPILQPSVGWTAHVPRSDSRGNSLQLLSVCLWYSLNLNAAKFSFSISVCVKVCICFWMAFRGFRRRAPAAEINKNTFILPVKRETPTPGFNNVVQSLFQVDVKKTFMASFFSKKKQKTVELRHLSSAPCNSILNVWCETSTRITFRLHLHYYQGGR